MITARLRIECTPTCPPGQVDKFVAELAEQAGLPPERSYWLRLAADEITTNISEHGYGPRGGQVVLSSGISSDRVWLRIEDEAPPFDPITYDPNPRLAAEPAARAPGGYGLLLARANLDGFVYEYVEGRNRNTLIMHRPALP